MKHAAKCVFQHSNTEDLGENIYMRGSAYDPVKAAEDVKNAILLVAQRKQLVSIITGFKIMVWGACTTRSWQRPHVQHETLQQ